MRKGDRAFGLICLAVSIWLLIEASRFDYLTEFTPGPGFALFWLGIILGLFSLYMIFNASRRKGGKEDDKRILPERKSLQRIGLIFLILTAFTVLLMPLGFLLSTWALVFALLYLLEGYSISKSIFYSILFSGISFLIFQYWMETELPKGLLGFGF
jgi:putative tricarboxylic transport membrane protein